MFSHHSQRPSFFSPRYPRSLTLDIRQLPPTGKQLPKGQRDSAITSSKACWKWIPLSWQWIHKDTWDGICFVYESTRKTSAKLPFGINQGTLQYNCMNDFSFLSYPHGIVEACHHLYSHDSYQMHPNAFYLRWQDLGIGVGYITDSSQTSAIVSGHLALAEVAVPQPIEPQNAAPVNHKILKILQVFNLTCTDFSTLFLEAGSTDQPLRPP